MMHRIVGAISSGEMYAQAVADNINSGLHDVEDGVQTGTCMVICKYRLIVFRSF